MTRLSRWVRITATGDAEIRVGKVELGQGILTALAQLAADELELDLARIRMLPAHTDHGPDEGLTSGSMSVAQSGSALRLVCANVRTVLVAEAARLWGVDTAELVVRDGCVGTADGSRTMSYGELSAVDLDVEVRPDVPVKPVARLRVAGTSAPRIDLPDKVTGRARFLADLRPPGLLHGRVVRPPAAGARLLSMSTVDLSGARVVRDGAFLGVLGLDEAEVVGATERVRAACTWSAPPPLPADPVARLYDGPHETILVTDDDVNSVAGRRIRARYSRPFLAHASIAPSCGLARWDLDGRLSVWTHSQGIYRLRAAIARALAQDPATIGVEHVENAGCYGHNGADDAAFDAVVLARAMPTHPVLVTWTRRDELIWSPLGSAMVAEVEATLGDDGAIRSWTYDVWSQGHTSRPGDGSVPSLLAARELDPDLPAPVAGDPAQPAGGTTRNAVPPYEVGPRRITGHRLTHTPVRSSALRSLGAFLNVFAIESFMDELAAACGRDPLEYRLAHLPDPRAHAVLRAAHAAAGPRTAAGRGLAFARYKENGAYCAVVADVDAEHDIRVRRLTIAVDVGYVVNPSGVRNQLEGGATQATSWTLKEQVRFSPTGITTTDWDTYPILRFTEAPHIHVELIASTAPSVGAGEAAQGPTAAAIANALTDALTLRLRDLPLTAEAVRTAIESAP